MKDLINQKITELIIENENGKIAHMLVIYITSEEGNIQVLEAQSNPQAINIALDVAKRQILDRIVQSATVTTDKRN